MKINWQIRFKNPVFWGQLILAIFTPILAYNGMVFQDLTTWGAVFEALKGAFLNPYLWALVVISVFNAVNDPTTKGLSDSARVLQYSEPFDVMKTDLNAEGDECDECDTTEDN